MPLPQPQPGLVIHYSYLWHDQKLRGLEEGTKERPCVIVSAMPVPGSYFVTVVPITHSSPRVAAHGLEIPQSQKQHLGLDEDRSWITVNDFNLFTWPGPDLRQVPHRRGTYAYGFISGKLLQRVRDGIKEATKTDATRVTQR